ncbi:MAG: flagellar biosynthetic protein FliQ [Planctomycetota bacterium]|jgi:flagellar biosynthetic protein FliQ
MNEDMIITVARETMLTVITVAGPMLLAGLAVGLTVSILQSITSIQEQALSMISKMLAVMTMLLLLMPWLLRVLKAFTIPLWKNLQSFIS